MHNMFTPPLMRFRWKENGGNSIGRKKGWLVQLITVAKRVYKKLPENDPSQSQGKTLG